MCLELQDPEDQEESGWKFVHGDVFRFPPSRSIFCAFVGTGTQLLVLCFCVFGLALVGAFYPYNRGAMFTALIVLYALTAGALGMLCCARCDAHALHLLRLHVVGVDLMCLVCNRLDF